MFFPLLFDKISIKINNQVSNINNTYIKNKHAKNMQTRRTVIHM